MKCENCTFFVKQKRWLTVEQELCQHPDRSYNVAKLERATSFAKCGESANNFKAKETFHLECDEMELPYRTIVV